MWTKHIIASAVKSINKTLVFLTAMKENVVYERLFAQKTSSSVPGVDE